jgi:hypothetical protein
MLHAYKMQHVLQKVVAHQIHVHHATRVELKKGMQSVQQIQYVFKIIVVITHAIFAITIITKNVKQMFTVWKMNVVHQSHMHNMF